MLVKLLLLFKTNSKEVEKMSTEKKNIWTVIINTVLTLITGLASAFGVTGLIG